MESKKYYIELLEHRIINHNDYWEDPMGNSYLRDNTEEAVKLLKSYFDLMKTLEKNFTKKSNNRHEEDNDNLQYDSYPENVKSIIKSIIDIINDGRDLWTPKIWKNRKVSDITSIDKGEDRLYNRCDKNDHLHFENNPWDEVNWCYSFLTDLEEVINSEKSTTDFKKYIDGKWHMFEGYESGSVSVRFTKINKTKEGIFTFDGDIINWATVDSEFDGDGIIIQRDCENISFTDLPYCDDEIKSDKELLDYLEYFYSHPREVETDEEVRKKAHEVLDNCLDEILD